MLSHILVNEHSSIQICSDRVIYCDPFHIGSKSKDADLILITHAHYDHFSMEDIKKVQKETTRFILPKSMCDQAVAEGLPKEKITAMKPWDEAVLDEITVTAVPSYNINKPMHPKNNMWLGYIVTLKDTRIYIAGDCDRMPEEIDIVCDIAMVPIGGTYTMDPAEAAAFVNAIAPSVAIPIHYGSIVGTSKDADLFESLVRPHIRVCRKLP